MRKFDRTFIIFILSFFIIYGFLYFIFDLSIPCYFKLLTGLYCPGCGITRMFISLFHFNIYQAFRYNPFVFVLLIIFFFIGVFDFFLYFINKKHIIISNKFYYFILIFLILFGVLRNIDFFSFLAPTIVK